MGSQSAQDGLVPEDCGHRLLPVVLDQIARDDPARAWAMLPYDDDDLSKGFEKITYATFANIINKVAWFIEENFGKSSNFETILYYGKPDIRYFAMTMACAKTGYKAFYSSHLNTLAIHLHLLEQTDCTRALSSSGVDIADIIAGKPGMAHHIVPELVDLLDMSHVAEPYLYTKTPTEAISDPYVVLHTSGTTGFPKPLVYTHGLMSCLDAVRLVPDVEGRKHVVELAIPGQLGAGFLMIASPYHSMSQCSLTMSIFGGAVYCPGFRNRATAPKDVYSILDHADGISLAALLPWIMEDMARHHEGEKYMSKFDWVGYGGGVLSSFCAEKWAKHTVVENMFASTETLAPLQLRAAEDENEYIAFDIENSGIKFVPLEKAEVVHGEARSVHEMVFTLTPQSAKFGACGVASYHARLGIRHEESHAGEYAEYTVGDLWTPHPDPKKSHFVWRFAGRKDDMFTFTSGLNLHPGTLEKTIGSHPHVKGVVVTGAGHQQAVALIELVEGVSQDSEEAAAVWKNGVEPANKVVQAHGNIDEAHTILVPCGSFIRTAKGSVVRKKTAAAFAEQIEETYRKFGDKSQHGEKK